MESREKVRETRMGLYCTRNIQLLYTITHLLDITPPPSDSFATLPTTLMTHFRT